MELNGRVNGARKAKKEGLSLGFLVDAQPKKEDTPGQTIVIKRVP
jgi:hypothetical protein